ncbi:MAG TPA: hypothetical protein VNO50_22290 [Pyrinomonadaceae bacterium]|nr:hypothetical protein [Pyrinomonadaceae bacterium]
MANLEYAVVVFADLRGFTAWSSMAAVAHHLQPFMADFYSVFEKSLAVDGFTFLKPNGDGVMFVQSTGLDYSKLDIVLDKFVLETLPSIEYEFEHLAQRYQRIMRCVVPLQLGFGINAGVVYRLNFKLSGGGELIDFASGTMNCAARLCDIARPAGVVIAAQAFPDWCPPSGQGFELMEVPVRNVSESFPVWMSKSVANLFPREGRLVTLEFHVGTVCYDPLQKILLLGLRRDDRELYPGLWETGGGQLLREEGIEDAAIRFARAEFGMESQVVREASMVPFRIETPRRTIPGIKVLCQVDSDKYSAYRNEQQHKETRAVALQDLLSEASWPEAMLIPGTKGIVQQLVSQYHKLHRKG